MSLYYLVTLQWATTRQVSTATRDGVMTLHPGVTRQQATETILAHARRQAGAPDHAAVVFLTIESNTL
ncbi:hypothetical protein ACIRBX_06580 [Kitasatospora sp. NPDC096147]|uniref:hypothetical protein n=1 Tax=Kitasatospora sp. NPDC096147 TaxID=3364093 RepID=UPI00382FCE42